MTDSEKLDFLVEAIAQQSEKLAQQSEAIAQQSEAITQQSEAMARQEERMDALEKNLTVVRSELREEIQGVRTELREEIQGVRTELGEEIQKLQKDVTGIKLVIENELRKNISIVAENHLDLTRKLDEYKKVSQEQEQISIRVNVLETYVRELREERTA